jgi:hypothetical protein
MSIRRILEQVYAYLRLTCRQFAILTCWYATWLIYCPADSPEVMYVSSAFLWTSTFPTALAAIFWQQEQALQNWNVQLPVYRGPVLEGENRGDGDSNPHSESDSADDPGDDSNDSDYEPSDDSEGSDGDGPPPLPRSSKKK